MKAMSSVRDDWNWPGDSITISQKGLIALTDVLGEAFNVQSLCQQNSQYDREKLHRCIPKLQGNLWTAYGLSTFLTLLCLIDGIIAFVLNRRRTFNAKFSTILRTTRDVPLIDRTDEKMGYVQIHDEDRNGKSPLPPYLKRAEISLSQNGYARNWHDVMDEIELNVQRAHRDVTSNDGGSSSRIQIRKD